VYTGETIMIHTLIQIIEHSILPLGAFGVFLAEIIEEVIVPIPSSIILLTSGFIFLKGLVGIELYKNLFLTVALPGALGLTLGSVVIYYCAYYGGKAFLDTYGKFLDITWDDVLAFDEKMNTSKYDEFLFISARIVPMVPSVLIAIFGGATRMPIRKYVLLTLIGAFIKASIMAFIGYKVGDLYYKYAAQIASIEKMGLMLIILASICFIGYRKYKKRQKKIS